MIKVESLTKIYNNRKAIDGISFEASKGEILGFLGPNGAGKSTTMKILSGYMGPSSGKALVNGFDVVKQSREAKASIGYLPELPPVYTNMDVQSYLYFAAELHGVPQKNLKSAVEEAMEKCAIADVRNRIIGNLSKGYRQRVGLAQAIAHKPPVLILDEPTVGLDPRQIIEIRNLIKSFEGQHTVILSTHILPEVQATCTRVVVIDQGKVIALDTLDGIASRMETNTRVTADLIHDPQAVVEQIQKLPGLKSLEQKKSAEGKEFSLIMEFTKGQDQRVQLAELLVKERLGLVSLRQEKLSLEDAFVKLITREELPETASEVRGG